MFLCSYNPLVTAADRTAERRSTAGVLLMLLRAGGYPQVRTPRRDDGPTRRALAVDPDEERHATASRTSCDRVELGEVERVEARTVIVEVEGEIGLEHVPCSFELVSRHRLPCPWLVAADDR